MAKVKIVHTTEYTYRSPVGLHAVCATGLYSFVTNFCSTAWIPQTFSLS
jgi:hypothetical protein